MANNSLLTLTDDEITDSVDDDQEIFQDSDPDTDVLMENSDSEFENLFKPGPRTLTTTKRHYEEIAEVESIDDGSQVHKPLLELGEFRYALRHIPYTAADLEADKKFFCNPSLLITSQVHQMAIAKVYLMARCEFAPVAVSMTWEAKTDVGSNRQRYFYCPCGGCKERFRNLERLFEHVCAHSKEPAFSCHKCVTAFFKRADLIRHFKRHRRKLTIKRWQFL